MIIGIRHTHIGEIIVVLTPVQQDVAAIIVVRAGDTTRIVLQLSHSRRQHLMQP